MKKLFCIAACSVASLCFKNSFAADCLFTEDSSIQNSFHYRDTIPAFDLLQNDTTPQQDLAIKTLSPKRAVQPKTLSARSVIIPSAMIAYGAFALTNKDLKKLNISIRKEVWEDRNKIKKLGIDDISLVAPAVAVYGLNIAGTKGKHNLVDRSILYTMSNIIGQSLIVSNVKKLSKVVRPDSSNRLSFPSGHTTQAFISAEFLRQEYKHISPWYGIGGYFIAAGTGFLRMYNNKHWLNDVIAGAGVGILSTRLSYWLYPKLKKTFLKKFSGNTMIVPTYQSQSFGVGIVHTFQ